jgi:cytochrome c oxidase cbb3-type subunit 2
MFEWKDAVNDEDKIVNVPDGFAPGAYKKLVARREALQLVAYLASLKQTPLPDGATSPEFLYERKEMGTAPSPGASTTEPIELDGAMLYASNCQACHQATGEGLKGAFPPLKGSAIVLNDNPEVMIDIIMSGYNAREEFGEMPPVGINNQLTAAQIAAIINHERTSWGNHARKIPLDEAERIITSLKTKTTNE